MSGSAPTRPDERYKREQCFRCPERARISWGATGAGELVKFGQPACREVSPYPDHRL
jgi:hypothetical protein